MASGVGNGEWAPHEGGVHQICQLLAEFQKPGCNQAQIYQQLNTATQNPEFNNYLAYILGSSENLPVEVRQSAGLLLKNNLKGQIATTKPEYRQYIQNVLLHTMGLNYRPLRQTAGTAIASIVHTVKMAGWPELLPALGQFLQSPDLCRQEGALDTIFKICEDSADQFEAAVLGPGDDGMGPQLLSLLLSKFRSEHTCVRRLALCVMNIITRDVEGGHNDILDTYLQGLFALANDEDPETRTAVCTGMIQMLAIHPSRLGPFMSQIIEYMIKRTQDTDENVALESCEFWTAFCEAQIDPAILKPFLPQLVPILLKNLIYTDDDDAVIKALDAENQEGEDQDKDIKPFHTGQHSERNNASDGKVDDGEDDNVYGTWTLRKCSAAGLDLLSNSFGDEILNVILPTVRARLQEPDWKARESAVLVLGAVAEGCRNGLEPHLNEILDVLLPMLSDPQPMVRIITCWAVGRYSERVIHRVSNGSATNGQVDAIIFGILKCVLDKNKQVQEAACSSLASVEEVAGAALLPRLKHILEHLATACSKYGRRNMRLLYDALSTLADSVGAVMAEPQHRALIMPALQHKWQVFQDTDHDLLPLLECLTALAIAFGSSFEEYAKPMFDRCVSIVGVQIEAKHAQQVGQPTTVRVDKDFIVSALDLLSGITEGIGASVESLVGGSPLPELLVECCKDEQSDVRQSGFALLGDLARACPGHLRPVVQDLCSLAVLNLAPQGLTAETKSVYNNVLWSLGELAVNLSPEVMRPYTMGILESAVTVLLRGQMMPRSILENVGIALGRVARICPEELAPHLGHFMGPWCQILRSIRDDIEKEHAFVGLCKLIRLNPLAATAAFQSLCEAVASWHRINNKELQQEMVQILVSFKSTFVANGQWEATWSQLQEPLRRKLGEMCGF